MGSLGSGAVTALALAVQTGLAAVVGVVLAREFGRGPETDGFFAAYGVFVVVVLAANAIRVTVLPSLARAREGRTLGGEAASYALAIAVVAVPLCVVAVLAAEPIASLLTGFDDGVARETAADTLPWMVIAAAAQLFAGLAASALAALDSYAIAAAGYALGSTAGLAYILARVDADGITALSIGMAVNGAVALAVPATALVVRARRHDMPATAVRPSGASLGRRLTELGSGSALPLALQALYVICIPLAASIAVGAVTSFGFAYLLGSAMVAVAAGSIGLVTAVPLARSGLDAERTARHVVSSSWLALVLVGATAGVFELAGEPIVRSVLGGAYGDDVGEELGRLVLALAPWAVASVALAVTFPLVFVAGRTRRLPLVALVSLAIHVPLAWAAGEIAGLEGLALALAITTAFVLCWLLHMLGALGEAARGLLVAAGTVALFAAVAFVPVGIALTAGVAAAVGLLVYVALVAVVRPRGLLDAWRYLRALA